MDRNQNFASRDRRADAPPARAPDPAELAPILDFAPVPLRVRRDGWTPERQRLYVAALAEMGHGGKAQR